MDKTLKSILDFFQIAHKGNIFIVEIPEGDEDCHIVVGKKVNGKMEHVIKVWDMSLYDNYADLYDRVDVGIITKEEFDDIISMKPDFFRKPARLFKKGAYIRAWYHYGAEKTGRNEYVEFDTEEQFQKEIDAMKAEFPDANFNIDRVNLQIDADTPYKDLRNT